MTRQDIEGRKNALYSLIKDREAKLKATDYVAAKIAEGVATKLEYAEVLAERQRCRQKINEAEGEIAELELTTPEDDEILRRE